MYRSKYRLNKYRGGSSHPYIFEDSNHVILDICLCTRMLTDQLIYSVVNKINLCTRYLRCWNITFRFETNTELTTTRGGEDTGKSSLPRSPNPATPCDLQSLCCQGDQLIGSDMSSPHNCCLV